MVTVNEEFGVGLEDIKKLSTQKNITFVVRTRRNRIGSAIIKGYHKLVSTPIMENLELRYNCTLFLKSQQKIHSYFDVLFSDLETNSWFFIH